MKNHTPKKCNLYYLSFYGQFKKGGGDGGGTGRTGERKTGTVGPQYPRP